MSEVVSAVASKMTRSVLGKLSQAGSVVHACSMFDIVCVRVCVCVFSGWLGWGGGGGGTTPPSKLKPQEKKMVMNLQMRCVLYVLSLSLSESLTCYFFFFFTVLIFPMSVGQSPLSLYLLLVTSLSV